MGKGTFTSIISQQSYGTAMKIKEKNGARRMGKMEGNEDGRRE